MALDDDREEGALFGLTRTLWVATANALVAVDEPADGPTAIVATGPVAGFAFEGGLVASVLTRLLREGHVASPDVKALLHELSPVDSAEAELLDPLTLDAGAPLRHRGGGVSPRFGALEL